MKYRVGRKLNRVILDENGNKIAVCVQGSEDVAQQICDLLNDKGLVNDLSQHLVSKRELTDKDMIEFSKWIISKGYEHRLDILPNELIGFYLVNKESIIKNNAC